MPVIVDIVHYTLASPWRETIWRNMSNRQRKSQTRKRTGGESVPSVQAAPSPVVDSNLKYGWIAVIGLGLGLRVLIAAISWGSNDAVIFWNFAHHISNRGLLTAYRENADFNHPPITGYWATASLRTVMAINDANAKRASDTLDISKMIDFIFIFKLPGILADGLSCWLLYRIWRKRAGERKGWQVAALFAWALAPILVSGYHGNTDTIYAALSLLAVYLLESRKNAFWGGIALGAAINVKLIPVFLIPPLLASLRNRREVIQFLGALALCALPFAPLFIAIGPEFYRNALAYKPGPDRWGLMLPMTWSGSHPPTYAKDPVLMFFSDYGRFLLLALVVAWSVVAARLRRWSRYEVAAGTYAIFLVVATGFGVQYTVVVAPLMFAASKRFGTYYSALAGLFLFFVYGYYWEGEFPLGSMFRGYFPNVAALVGIPVWLILIGFLIWLARKKPTNDAGLIAPNAGEPRPGPDNGAAAIA